MKPPITIPCRKTGWKLWAYLESERFLHPVMREFYKERNVVIEERRMRTDSNPTGRLLGTVHFRRVSSQSIPSANHWLDRGPQYIFRD